MAKITARSSPNSPSQIVRDDLIGSLLDTCNGRDAPIIRLLLDTGGRLGEIAALTVDDVDFDLPVGNVVGKGRRGRAIPFGAKTTQALARHLRVLAKESGAPEKLRLSDATAARPSRTATRSGSCSADAPARWDARARAPVAAHPRPHVDDRRRRPTGLMWIMGWKPSPDIAPIRAQIAPRQAVLHRRPGRMHRSRPKNS
ncbi:site-specific integrase [Actinophytocola oryzae]|uniref:site-specific integrase n=1 Tax=Actinophytocola oryzae TaxID=502181 RepID=UPI001062DB2A